MEEKTNMYLVSIVAIVAIVGLVVLYFYTVTPAEEVYTVDENGEMVPATGQAFALSRAGLRTYRKPMRPMSEQLMYISPNLRQKQAACVDNDGDKFTVASDGKCKASAQIDCDDNNNKRFPGNMDICGNGIDEDCSGADLV